MRLLSGFVIAALALCQAPQPDGAGVRAGTLPVRWITGGPNCVEVPDWQVHEYNEDFYILRESGCTNYEKPFLYLIFGKDRVMLEDTGAGKPETARAVTAVIEVGARATTRASIPLVVTHSHSHGDHVAGDAQFQNLANTTMVPLNAEETAQFFHIEKWPEGIGSIDLGDRVLDVIAIPGHDKLSIAFYDRQTGMLLTGDSLYPGRLYVRDFPEFVRSTQRLVDFTKARSLRTCSARTSNSRPHRIKIIPFGRDISPMSMRWPFTRGTLLELNEALAPAWAQPRRMAMRDFTIWPNKRLHDPIRSLFFLLLHPHLPRKSRSSPSAGRSMSAGTRTLHGKVGHPEKMGG